MVQLLQLLCFLPPCLLRRKEVLHEGECYCINMLYLLLECFCGQPGRILNALARLAEGNRWPGALQRHCLRLSFRLSFFLLQVAGTCRNNQAGMGMIVTLAVVDVQNHMGFADPYGFWLSLSQ